MDAKGTSVDRENSGSVAPFRTALKPDHKRESEHNEGQREKNNFLRLTTGVMKMLRGKKEPDEDHPEGVKLNVALCGSDRRLKSFISNLILNQSESESGSELSSECVRRDMDLHGRLISLVELPALINSQLSEEEVMRQSLRCVSLCDPGVHVFINIIPDGPLNNEDKTEIEKIQKIFSSRINKHLMILIYQNPDHQTADLNEEPQSVFESFGGRHLLIGPNTHVSVLIEELEQMVQANSGVCFSTETLWDAQMEKLQRFEEMKIKIHSMETWFQSKDSRERADEVRIVLLGKTGVGKSATGNTILGREAFTAETSQQSVTKESKRESSEIYKRHVIVIDTPGLFDTELTNEEIKREITNCIPMILPGPHVFIIVLNLGQRFTREEEKSVNIIQETFGDNSLKFTMVLFTRGDYLKNKTLEQCLGKPGSPLMNLIEICGNRYHVFNNNQTEDRTQVSDLLKKIDNMVKENGDSYYSCKMFREMEREKQEQQQKKLKDEVEQLKREREELLTKHKEEIKREREEWKRQKQQERQRRDEEDERKRKKEQEMRDEYNQKLQQVKERMEVMIEEERQNHDRERKRREEENERRRKIEQETWDEYYHKLKQEREKRQKEKEDLQFKHEEEMKRVKMMIEEERQYIEGHERQIRKEMKRERDEWERQKQQERQREEEEKAVHRSNELQKGTPKGQHTKKDSPPDSGSLRILLFGRTGHGKSATGNTFLGKDEFHSEASKCLVTTTSQKAVGEVDGKSVTVVDTPGLFNTSLTNEQVVEEIIKSVSLSAPGPHVFINVLSLGSVTQVERDPLYMIKKIFGPEAAKFSIVLFTKGDELKGQTIKQYVETSKNEELKKLIRDCGNRFLAFNNTEPQDRTQVTELLKMIEELKKSNMGQYFTNEMFEEAAISLKQGWEMIQEMDRNNQTQVEELKARYDMEVKRMIERLKEKKQKTDEQRVKLENKFREKQETLWRKFEEKEKEEDKKQEEDDQKQSEKEKQRRDEYDERVEEMEREIKNQRLQYEKQQNEREDEDSKREEEYKQDQEKMKTEQEHIMAELRRKREEKMKKRDFEKQTRKEEEEKEREEWKRKMAEDDKGKQEGIKQLREWEKKKKKEMKEQEEEERKIKERHKEQLREKQEELEKMRERFDAERGEKRKMIEEEREKQEREKEEKERDYEKEINEMKRRYEQLERERKEEWKRRKQEDEERRREKRKRWEKMIKNLKCEQEEEMKRREREEGEAMQKGEKECDEMKLKYKEELEELKKKHRDEIRIQEEELYDIGKRKKQLKERLEKEYEVKMLQRELKEKGSCHVM